MKGQVFTIAKLHYINGVVYFTAREESTDLKTLAEHYRETTKSGNVKHPMIRIRTLVRFAEGLGLVYRVGKTKVAITELGGKYYQARAKEKWSISEQQKENLRKYILSNPSWSPTIYSITSLLALVENGFTGNTLSRQYAAAIGKEDTWQSDVTFEGFTNFGLDYLKELGFIQESFISQRKIELQNKKNPKPTIKTLVPSENRTTWSDEELLASIDAYREMLFLHRRGEPYIKKDYYRALADKFGRTEKAFEFRAQNISHVLALLGREWLPGLLPARNVGTNVIERIEKILAEAENTKLSGSATFEAQVRGARKKKVTNKPKGNKKPSARTLETTQYDRDPEVKAWVLENASGVCESCGENAPFLTYDGLPFLEVHHVTLLAEGGPDCVENAVAVCPNCHSALHYSIDRSILKEKLYANIERLKR